MLYFIVQLLEQYGSVWHHSRVRRYLTSEDWTGPESKGKPWYGLLMLLRKYPEHFVINTRSKGRVTLEFVSLVSLLSWNISPEFPSLTVIIYPVIHWSTELVYLKLTSVLSGLAPKQIYRVLLPLVKSIVYLNHVCFG